jgi:hypothetical protein
MIRVLLCCYTVHRYNGHGIILRKVHVLRNALSPAAPYVGALVLGGFDSPVGDHMPVELRDCLFVGNRPADMSEQVNRHCETDRLGQHYVATQLR